MTELGSRLREARKAKGLSLDDLQEMTKIQKRYLKGIEEGNYEIIPGKFYVRAFIKQYAEAVGLESNQIFDEFKSEVPVTHNEDLTEQISRVKSRKTVSAGASKVFNILPTILIVIFIIAAAFLVWVLVQKFTGSGQADKHVGNNSQVEVKESGKSNVPKSTDNSKNNTTDNNQSNNTNDNSSGNDSTNTQADQNPVQELKVVSSNGGNSTFKLSKTDKFNVTVTSTGKTWVQVKNAKGHSFYQGLLNKGDKQTFDLTKEAEAFITIGNAADTEIYVNDQKLDYAISPTDIVRQDITIQFEPFKTE